MRAKLPSFRHERGKQDAGLSRHRGEDLVCGCALGDAGRHPTKRRRLVSDFSAGTLGGHGAAGCVRGQLAHEDRYAQIGDEVHQVGGIRELERVRRGEVEPVEGEYARHPRRDRVGDAGEPGDRDHGEEVNNAQERDSDVRSDALERHGCQSKGCGTCRVSQRDLRAEREPMGILPCGHWNQVTPAAEC